MAGFQIRNNGIPHTYVRRRLDTMGAIDFLVRVSPNPPPSPINHYSNPERERFEANKSLGEKCGLEG